ncbi:MAG: alpha/beta hydrolase [Polyangia bacterium]
MRSSIFAVAALTLSGCFARAELACRDCAIVRVEQPAPPPTAEGHLAVVVLLHGAFGFGSEWTPIRSALAKRPELAWWVFSWPGPFGGDVHARAEAFRIALQATVSQLPSTAHDVLVLAHSAGGAVADYAARRLVVPDGVTVHVALLDSARISLAKYHATQKVDTPMGVSLDTTQDATPEVPRGVVVDDYRAGNPPKHGSAERTFPPEVGVLSPRGEHVHWLGKVTHGGAVGLAGLPLIEALP